MTDDDLDYLINYKPNALYTLPARNGQRNTSAIYPVPSSSMAPSPEGHVMSTRCASLFTAFVAAGLLLSTVGGTTPQYIWNASDSVPIGLYHVQPASRLTVTELVAVQPPDLLAASLDLNGYLPIGIPMLKRVLALPGQTVCRNGLTIAVDGIDMGQAHERDARGRPPPVWHGCHIIADGDIFVMN